MRYDLNGASLCCLFITETPPTLLISLPFLAPDRDQVPSALYPQLNVCNLYQPTGQTLVERYKQNKLISHFREKYTALQWRRFLSPSRRNFAFLGVLQSVHPLLGDAPVKVLSSN